MRAHVEQGGGQGPPGAAGVGPGAAAMTGSLACIMLTMVLKRQVITALQRDRVDMLGTRCPAIKIADESIVAGLLLTVESNHFCLLKSRGAVLNIYEMGQYAPTTSDKPIIGSIAQGFFGGASPWHGKDAATIVAALAETEAGLKAIEATRRDRQALLLAIE